MKSCTRDNVCIICLKVPNIHVKLKYKSFLLHSAEEKNTRTLSFGIQNDDEAIIKLLFTVFANIKVNVQYF